jgi:hypothetical protein
MNPVIAPVAVILLAVWLFAERGVAVGATIGVAICGLVAGAIQGWQWLARVSSPTASRRIEAIGLGLGRLILSAMVVACIAALWHEALLAVALIGGGAGVGRAYD